MLPPGSPCPLPAMVFHMKLVAIESMTPTAKPTRANTVYGPACRCVKLLVDALAGSPDGMQSVVVGSMTTPSRDAACSSPNCCKVIFAFGPVQLQLSPCNTNSSQGVLPDMCCGQHTIQSLASHSTCPPLRMYWQ